MNKKKRERIEARKRLKEWADNVKKRDNYECAICGRKENLDSHHIIPKEIKELKFEVINGITLCKYHHKFNTNLSAHRNSFMFLLWLKEKRREQIKSLLKKYNER